MTDRSSSLPDDRDTEDRRRVLELTLDRRPELSVADLHDALAAVGLDAPTDVLLDDLDSLGYDVDEPAEPEVAPGDGERRHSAAPARTVAADDAGDDAWTRRSLVIAGAVAVAVIVVGIVLAGLGGGADEGEATPTTLGGAGAAQAASGAEETTTASTGPQAVAPVGPGRDPALDVFGTVTDDFERGEVGDFPGLGPWEVLGGEWSVVDGDMAVTTVPDDAPAVVAIDAGSADLRAQVQVDRRTSRSGLAFRVVDDRNFLLWATLPEYATTTLLQVVDGESTVVLNSGITRSADGLPSLGVNLVGTTAELLHDGVVVATWDQLPPAEGGATRIGMAALPGSGELPLFDDLRVLRP